MKEAGLFWIALVVASCLFGIVVAIDLVRSL